MQTKIGRALDFLGCFGSVGFIKDRREESSWCECSRRCCLVQFNRGTAPDPGEEPPDLPCKRNGFLHANNWASGFAKAQREVVKGQLLFGKRNLARNLKSKPCVVVIQERSGSQKWFCEWEVR